MVTRTYKLNEQETVTALVEYIAKRDGIDVQKLQQMYGSINLRRPFWTSPHLECVELVLKESKTQEY